jgi:hypothetical protein
MFIRRIPLIFSSSINAVQLRVLREELPKNGLLPASTFPRNPMIWMKSTLKI